MNSSAEGGFHYSIESSNRNTLQFTGTRKSIVSETNRESPSKMSEAFKMPTEQTPTGGEVDNLEIEKLVADYQDE